MTCNLTHDCMRKAGGHVNSLIHKQRMDVNLSGHTAAKVYVTQNFTDDCTRKAYGHVNSVM